MSRVRGAPRAAAASFAVLASRLVIVAVVLLTIAVAAHDAAAHTRSVSYSRWALDGREARVELRIPLLELARYPADVVTPERLAAMLTLHAGDDLCAAADVRRVDTAPDGWAMFRWAVRCDVDGPRSLRSTLITGRGGHAHLARVSTGGAT